MQFSRGSLWLALFVFVLSASASIGQERTSSETVRALELRPVFSDDFSSDSLSDYQVTGDVVWEKVRLKLAKGASVSRSFEVGSRVKVVAELEFPKLTKDADQSLTVLRIDRVGVPDCFVAWQQTRANAMTVEILDIVSKDGKFRVKVVRSVSVSGPLEFGEWSVEYRHGLLQVRRQEHKILSGYINYAAAVCGGIRWTQSRGVGTLNRHATLGVTRPAPLSEEQQTEVSEAATLYSQVVQLRRQRKIAEATRLLESVLGIRRKAMGVDHPDYMTSLNNLAFLYKSQGNAAKAESLYLEVLDIQKRVLGVEHPNYATSLYNLAELYHYQGGTAKAEPLYLEARDIFKRVLGVEHPSYARSLNNLAVLYRSQGDLVKAEPLILEALDIRKRVLGVEHPSYATSLNNLARLYKSQGNAAKAELLYLEARDIRKRVLGVEHPDYATSLTDLAMLYNSQGDAAKAEPLHLEARDIFKRVLGVEHPAYATSLNNLATLYMSQGDAAKAEPLHLEARDITKRVLGVEHPDYAISLNNLAELYRSQGNVAKAEPLYLEARDIQKRVLGVEHLANATSLNNLAALYMSQGDSAKAEPLYLEARDIIKRVLGVEHPDYARSLNNLAMLYRSQGKYAKAEPLFRETLGIQERVTSVGHPDYSAILNNLAVLYECQGDFAKAEPLFRDSLKLSRQLIDRNAIGQSQTTQLNYAVSLRFRLDSLISHSLDSSSVESWLSDEMLSWKGMTLVRQRQYRLDGEDARTGPILKSLTVASRQLSAQLRKTPSPKTQKAWRQQVSDLSEKRDRLETQLAAASPEFQRASKRLTTDELLETLPKDAVLVDFLSFKFWQRVPQEDYNLLKSSRHFLATVLRKGRPVEFVNLGPEADINEAVDQWRRVFLSKNADDIDKVEPAGRELRNRVWEPLLPHLQGAKTVVLCPDRVLGRVAFAALPGREKGTYLIEDHRLACISVPQLLPAIFRKVAGDQRPESDVLIIGDVDYAANSQPSTDSPQKKKRRRGSEELFQDVAFTPLDETAGEIAAIRDLFFEVYDAEANAVRTLRKQQATEAAFRKYAGKYETLHIATHGFFADPTKKSAEQHAEEENPGNRSGLFGQNENSLAFARGFHPGMLSGLALAGANHAPTSADDDDGILTADEISFQRLEGVDLVVLSACETGLGAVAGGEGLLGVQRAFQVSGARSVVASLWNVDDVATRRLMERFYRNLWDKEMGKLDALREAQLWMLNNPGSVRGTLVRLKSAPKETLPKPETLEKRTDPRFWAAFVLSGDWR